MTALRGNVDDLAMVLDVESRGLHGEGFAYALTVVDLASGAELQNDMAWCPKEAALIHPYDPVGTDAWLEEHVMPHLRSDGRPPLATPRAVREHFWARWSSWINESKNRLWADCAWPVEARFLLDCVKDDPTRTWTGPYPLQEIATVIQLAGGDPLVAAERLPHELPAHHPLADTRQSARRLVEHRRRVLCKESK